MEKWKEFVRKSKKYKKRIVAALTILVVSGAATYYVAASDFPGGGFSEGGGFPGGMEFSGDMNFPGGAGFGEESSDAAKVDGNVLTAEGTTQVLTTEQSLDFETGRVRLTVEEVYAEAGDTVKEGDALLKLTEESMNSLTAYYNQEIKEAKEAVNEAKINQETGLLEAEYTLQQSLSEAAGAQASYDAAISELELSVEEKKESYEDTQQKIMAYNEAVIYNYFYDADAVAEREARLAAATGEAESANAALTEAQNTYNAKSDALKAAIGVLETETAGAAEAATGTISAASTANLLTAYKEEQAAKTELSAKQQTAQTASGQVQQIQKEIENANREYESKVTNAKNQVEILSAQLEGLQSNYEKAQRDAETKKLELSKEYETKLLTGEYAQEVYDKTVAGLSDAVANAEDTLTELEEAFAVINGMEKGILCAGQSGTLASVSYDAGDILWGNSTVASYYDMSKVYISIEVEQAYIAKLTVGEEASVRLNGARNSVTAKIASIASEKTSDGSISNVTYEVKLVLDNSNGSISAGVAADISIEL